MESGGRLLPRLRIPASVTAYSLVILLTRTLPLPACRRGMGVIFGVIREQVEHSRLPHTIAALYLFIR